MILTFPVRVLGGTVTPEIGDNPVTLPPTLQPVITFPGAMVANNNVGLTAKDSFCVATEKQQVASQIAYVLTLCTFGAGIWEFTVTMKFHSDYTLPPISGTLPAVQLGDPSGNIGVWLINSGVIANQHIYLQAKFLMNFNQAGFQLIGQGPGTGVGQTYDQTFSVIANRLA